MTKPKVIIAILLVIIPMSIIAVGASFLQSRNAEAGDFGSGEIDPATLPPNALHLSTSQIPGYENQIQINVIGNIQNEAAGFDFALQYPADVVRPILNVDDEPATLGMLFQGSQRAVNEVAEIDSFHGQVRVVYVFFGNEQHTHGAGNLATINLEVLKTGETAALELVNPRISTLDAAGNAAYVSLNIGDPEVTLSISESGVIRTIIGRAPISTFEVSPVAVAILMMATGAIGLVALGIWQLTIRSNRKQSTLQTA
ncbi:MAG: hypothetical protein KC615_13875 [Anaerolineae bacterium]|nr:hypothetical protein [Anaerolineae bacterium]MCA9894071.1 hypothetical protein [Anaerolineae bacterium]